jgi:hypothetical protein
MTTPNVSDVGDSNPSASGTPPEGSSQTVSYETFTKLLGQKKAADQKLQEQNAKLAEFEAAESAKREEQLRAAQQHDQIIAEVKARNAELEARIAKTQTDIANGLKLQALERATGGFAHPDYMKFANLDSIGFSEDGNVDATALALEAKRLRETHPHLLKTAPSPLPNGAPKTAFQPDFQNPVAVSWGDAAQAFMNKKGK